MLARIIEERSFYRNDDEHVFYEKMEKTGWHRKKFPNKYVMVRPVFQKEIHDGLHPFAGNFDPKLFPQSTLIADAMFRLHFHLNLYEDYPIANSIALYITHNYADPISHGIPPYMSEAISYFCFSNSVAFSTKVTDDKKIIDFIDPVKAREFEFDRKIYDTFRTPY